jgi:hypothetical protein
VLVKKYDFLPSDLLSFLQEVPIFNRESILEEPIKSKALQLISLFRAEIEANFTDQELYLENIGKKKNEVGDLIPLHWDSSDIAPVGRREYACHIYLNNEFKGGSIVFPDQDVNEVPVTNMALVFPTSEEYRHEMKAVSEGSRYAILIHFTTNKALAPLHDQLYNAI